MRTPLVLIIAGSLWLTACARGSSPVAPSPTQALSPVSSIGLTVRVLTRTTELPISGASVFDGNGPVGFTDTSGELRTNVPLGVEFHIRVAAPGYVGFEAIGTVNSDERWTFYLEPAR